MDIEDGLGEHHDMRENQGVWRSDKVISCICFEKETVRLCFEDRLGGCVFQ